MIQDTLNVVKNGDDASGTPSSAAPASSNKARASFTSPSASARTAAKWRAQTATAGGDPARASAVVEARFALAQSCAIKMKIDS
jgi:hypothetical protein